MAYYLQNYLEDLELLPNEIQNGFADIEQLDSQVEDSMVQTSKRVDVLFSNANGMDPNELKTRFNAIMEDGEKSLETCDNKIQITNRMTGLLNKYLKRLDDDLHEMKTELEANSSGITEIIEQNVSEQNGTTNKNENKNQLKKGSLGDKKKVSNNNRNSKRKSRKVPSHTVTSKNITTISKNDTNIVTSLINIFLKPVETDSTAIETAIEAAVSEAVIAQQQSTEGHGQALTGQNPSALEKLPIKILINGELARVFKLLNNKDKKTKNTKLNKTQKSGTSTEEDLDMNESVDSNETLYCICKNVAYGAMIACDNKKCPSEWFHYGCVGIKNPPKGKWFCPHCITIKKNRRSRK